MRWPEPMIGTIWRFGGRPGFQMSRMPSRPSDCQELTSTMILSAALRYDTLLPTEEVGTRPPDSVMRVASTTATLRSPKKPCSVCGPECDKWMSE